ncbi:MAG: OadG family protein [SAR324 cluster bacterium]|nr:OadG family protein [SAR324 cluster bacterium]
MIMDGLQLLVMGMVTVYLFLIIMILGINLVSNLTREHSEKERLAMLKQEQELRDKKRKKLAPTSAVQTAGSVPVAVFAAAIDAFEADRNR